MTEILIRRRIERHAQAAAKAKGKDQATYWRERRAMLAAQAELYQVVHANAEYYRLQTGKGREND